MKQVKYLDYIDELHTHFPDINKASLTKLIRHGLNNLAIFKSNNLDIYLNDDLKKHYYYFGEITNDPVKRQEISNKKIIRKLRTIYRIKKTKYDGYYYFTLNNIDYELHKSGTPIPMVILHKVREEAYLYRIGNHLFKVKIKDDSEWTYEMKNYETSSTEFIGSRSNIQNNLFE